MGLGLMGKWRRRHTFSDLDGNKYFGGWSDNSFNGEGTYSYSNGDKYKEVGKKNKFNGRGTFLWESGDKYVGNWLNGLKQGRGIFTSSNDKYTGDWIADNQTVMEFRPILMAIFMRVSGKVTKDMEVVQ